MKKTNAGYEIIDEFMVENYCVVLAYAESLNCKYVTWRYFSHSNNFEHGNYFYNELDAKRDFLKRALRFIEISEPEPDKPYFYSLHKVHSRTLEKCAVVTGVVFAKDEREAEEKAWERDGGDNACSLSVKEIPTDGYSYRIPV